MGDEGIGAALDMVAAAGRHVEDMARAQSSARTPAVGASVPLGPVPRQRGLQPQPLHFRSSDPPGVLAVRALTGLCWVLKTRRQVEETDVARAAITVVDTTGCNPVTNKVSSMSGAAARMSLP